MARPDEGAGDHSHWWIAAIRTVADLLPADVQNAFVTSLTQSLHALLAL